MGNDSSVPTKIGTSFLYTEDGRKNFKACMEQQGFAVLTMDETLKSDVLNYLAGVKTFFSQDSASKLQLSSQTELMKKNEGYLLVAEIKEYLKLKKPHPKIPYPENFSELFDKCFDSFFKLSDKCFEILATDTNSEGQPYMKTELFQAIRSRTKDRSSISVIHYFPRNAPKEGEEKTHYDRDQEGTEGVNVPSKEHTDTGVLTFILCSRVPGLQVQNKSTGEWTPVEILNDPESDLFCIMGNKMEIFSAEKEAKYKSTVHRVILPYGIERYSILFFVDVPQ